jgi:hypothetical protein
MRTDVSISNSKLAIHTQNLKTRRVFVSLKPIVKLGATTYLLSMFISITIDVINTKKYYFSLFATDTASSISLYYVSL